MLPIFLKTLPFFLVIGAGYLAARLRFFPPEATAWLTRFVFFFPLSAMLFMLTHDLSLAALWEPAFVAAYLGATGGLFVILFALARFRGNSLPEAAVEAQCGVVGNTGFLGIPMLAMLLGPQSATPLLKVLLIDMIVFSSLVSLFVAAGKAGGLGLGAIWTLLRGLVGNPMIVAIMAGFGWSASGLDLPLPAAEALTLLAAATTPCALFVIGASLAERSGAGQAGVALSLSFCKLILHPAAVAVMALIVFPVGRNAAEAMIAAAALPVAGNIYILARHYGVAAARVSAAILISTAASIVTVPLVISWLAGQ